MRNDLDVRGRLTALRKRTEHVLRLQAVAACDTSTEPRRQVLGKAILVVEDDTNARTALEELFQAEGFCVLSASTPEEALALSQCAGSLDVVLADLRLPRMSGDVLARRLQEQHPSLRVILMSGMPAPQDDGSTLFVQKPIDFDALIALLDT